MKEIEGFEDYYVDEESNVWSRKYHFRQNINKELRKLKSGLDTHGYPMVYLHINGKKRNKTVHRLVALAFIPNPDNKPYINHKNGIKTDCRVSNLEWVTAKENTQHSYDTGLIGKGEKHHQSKLTEEQVLAIRADTRSQRKIAAEYGVCNQLISLIIRREIWKHI